MLLAAVGLASAPAARAQAVDGPAVDVPRWAQEAVWYQIFPERFRNGDRGNDPTRADLQGAWPHVQPDGWQVSDWTSDWYAQADWEENVDGGFYRAVQTRRYGGDLQGVIDKLGYLDSLGVTAIYLNPIFESPSLHKYDGVFYHHVDDNFGPDPEGDRAAWGAEAPADPATWRWTSADRLFLELIERAHARGLRVVLDGVFNHMGVRSFAFQDVRARQQASPYRDWFAIAAFDDPATPDVNEFAYNGWLGVDELPELRENEQGLVPPVRDYVFASVRRWMDPNGDGDPADGIDGWRLDAAETVDLDFWAAFRDTVRAINPEAYLVGEVWWEDWDNHEMHDARPWLDGTAFDAVMNYRWAVAARRFFLGADLEGEGAPGNAYAPSDFAAELARLREDYPASVNYALMNTVSTHDTDRLASQIVNAQPRTRFDHEAGASNNDDYRVRKPRAAERQTQKLFLAHQFTYVGAPHLFYGDEAGLWGGDDPDERKPMLWPELDYDDETAHPRGQARPADDVAFDRALHAYYRRLAHLRTSSKALTRGSFRVVLADDARDLFAYERRYGQERVWVAFNRSGERRQVTLPVAASLPAEADPAALEGAAAHDALTDRTAQVQDGALSFALPAKSARVWVLRR